MIQNVLLVEIRKALEALGLKAETEIKLEHSVDPQFGDYSTNIALILDKKTSEGPKILAAQIKEKILAGQPKEIKEIQIAGPGFLNFYLTDEFFISALKEIISTPDNFGQTGVLAGRKVMVEYTDPNPFKEFHIGHLMSNIIGESLGQIIEANGAETKRACYQGDVGLHVAKALWGMFKLEGELPKEKVPLTDKIKFLGRAYALGAAEYEEGTEDAKQGIIIINKKIYKRSDSKLNELYDLGREWSLEYFETIYKRLGTNHNEKENKAFDFYFFESETGPAGQKLVEEGLAKEVFEKSDGAVIFHGEKHDSSLHTRVFLNAEGLPTYEAKDLGLAKIKANRYPADSYYTVTGNEIKDYFRVVMTALKQLEPDLASKIKHVPHGMLRLPSGKMSSRTGQVITAESLITDVKAKVFEKINERDLTKEEKEEIAEKVAVGAIKYSILKQSIGKDIIFDFDKSLSFEGDSGPYLQYAYTRALSVLKKAEINLKIPRDEVSGEAQRSNLERLHKGSTSIGALEKLLYQLPEVVERSYQELAPQNLVSYLIEVAGAYNSFYANNKIIGSEEEAYRLMLTMATTIVLKNGLTLLGVPVLEKM